MEIRIKYVRAWDERFLPLLQPHRHRCKTTLTLSSLHTPLFLSVTNTFALCSAVPEHFREVYKMLSDRASGEGYIPWP